MALKNDDSGEAQLTFGDKFQRLMMTAFLCMASFVLINQNTNFSLITPWLYESGQELSAQYGKHEKGTAVSTAEQLGIDELCYTPEVLVFAAGDTRQFLINLGGKDKKWSLPVHKQACSWRNACQDKANKNARSLNDCEKCPCPLPRTDRKLFDYQKKMRVWAQGACRPGELLKAADDWRALFVGAKTFTMKKYLKEFCNEKIKIDSLESSTIMIAVFHKYFGYEIGEDEQQVIAHLDQGINEFDQIDYNLVYIDCVIGEDAVDACASESFIKNVWQKTLPNKGHVIYWAKGSSMNTVSKLLMKYYDTVDFEDVKEELDEEEGEGTNPGGRIIRAKEPKRSP